jgi:chemotaxis receptor (MCP) glutamine deamidase CheD
VTAAPNAGIMPALSKQTREREVVLYIGGVHASEQPIVIKTLLGSCISVCLYDPVEHVGGMNHFMLPRGGGTGLGPDATRFGVHAMDCLIGAVMKVGGDRRRLVAKCFGGAHVLDVRESVASVPQQNIEFIRTFLQDEGFRIAAEDMGGYHPRHVHFHPRAGRAFVKRVESSATASRLVAQERPPEIAVPQYGDVTLFE